MIRWYNNVKKFEVITVKTFLISDIINITEDYLIYLDNKIETKISLKDCAVNWANEYNQNVSNYICYNFETKEETPAQPIEDVATNRCVGDRDWFDEKPYFIFYCNPKIRFEIIPQKRFIDFLNKHWVQRYYNEFYTIQKMLYKYEWKTYDLG